MEYCYFYGDVGLTVNQAYIQKRCSCPKCGRVWKVGEDRGPGKLGYRLGAQDEPVVRIPKHKAGAGHI